MSNSHALPVPSSLEGHLVYTTDDRIRTVSHILVDYSTKPFQLGMLKELLKQSALVTATHDQALVNPNIYLLKNGESALNYIGQWVKKSFDGEWFRGRVT